MEDQLIGKDFYAIKIGDVNNSAKYNATGMSTEVRSGKALQFVAEDAVIVKGENVEIPVRANNFNEVYGFQYSMNTGTLKLVEVRSGALQITSTNYATPRQGLLTMSWNSTTGETYGEDEVLFVLVFRSDANVNAGSEVELTSTVTRREAYMGSDMEEVGVTMVFIRTVDPVDGFYALSQNEPNPFRDETVIRFNLAEAGMAKFTISDNSGRVLAVREVEGAKGANMFTLRKGELQGASGILFYQMEAGDFVTTKKMIAID
jgi:hypothetical protein